MSNRKSSRLPRMQTCPNCFLEFNEGQYQSDRKSALDACQECGWCYAVIPSIETQKCEVLDGLRFNDVILAKQTLRANGCLLFKERTYEEEKKFVELMIDDVVARIRKNCNSNNCAMCQGWEVFVRDGILEVRFTITSYGWSP